MKVQSVLALAAMAGLASSASAQFITTPGITADVHLSWVEDPSGPTNNNGILDQGEKALIFCTITITNNVAVQFSPAIGPFSSGTVLGLGTAYLDIRSASGDATGLYNNGITAPTSTSTGPNANTAGTSGYGVRGGWRLGGNAANGQPVSNGFANIGPGQLPTDPSGAHTDNPLTNLIRLGWAPNSYAERTQNFAVGGALGAGANAIGLYLDLDGGTTGGIAYVPLNNVTFGHVDIPIAPAPASLALLGLGGLVAGRRRR